MTSIVQEWYRYTNLSTLNETLAFLDAVKQGHHDYNQQYDDSKGDSKDQNKILVDILYASIVDDDVFLDVVQLVTGGGDFVRNDGREVHVSLPGSVRWL